MCNTRMGLGALHRGILVSMRIGLWKQRDHGLEDDRDAGFREEVEERSKVGEDWGVRGADEEHGVERDRAIGWGVEEPKIGRG